MTAVELHTITLSHRYCDHTPGDTFICNAWLDTAVCLSEPGARCRFGCTDCVDYWAQCGSGRKCEDLRQERIEEDDDLSPDDVPHHPEGPHCTEGHAFAEHDCWAIDWIQSYGDRIDEGLFTDSDQPGPGEVWPDGPVEIVDWSEDGFIVTYVSEQVGS